MKQINVYTFAELPDDAKDRVVDREINRRVRSGDCPWIGEIRESIDAAIAAVQKCPKDLRGHTVARGMAWLENNVWGPLRTPWRGSARTSTRRYGWYYRPDAVKPCPWTGYCADEDAIAEINNAVRGGYCLVDDVPGLLRQLGERLAESEWYAWTSADAVPEELAEDDQRHYTIDGRDA